MNQAPPLKYPRLWRYTVALALAWTAAMAISLWWSVREAKRGAQEAALIQARQSHEKDVLYRRWNSLHGGVYAPVTKQTPPNPYLTDEPERDIETPSGKKLTLINPAYMIRQVFELGYSEHGVHANIASLRPLRPGNAAGPWEAEALKFFERGETEYHQVQDIEGQAYLRFMRPLVTEQSCLACHKTQGEKVGNIRGGISIAVPLQELSVVAQGTINQQALMHLILWLLGVGGLALGTVVRLHEADKALHQAHDTLEQRVLERTAELMDSQKALRLRNEELATLNAVGRQVTQTLSVDEVVSEAVKELVKASQAAVGFIFLRDGETLALAGIGPEGAAQKFGEVPEHRVGECLCGLAIQEGRPFFSQDIFADARCTWEECKRAGFRSFAALPLRSGEYVFGVAGLACQEKRDFESQAAFLETLASQVASGINNARLHQEVRRHVLELEQRVLARTEQLKAKNEELSAFTYTVSYDLKAPLRGIAGYASELDRKHRAGLGERAQFCLTQVLAATRNLDQLIEDLLYYSRLDAETLSVTGVDLRGLIDAILQDHKLAMAKQGVEVTIDIPFTTLRTWKRALAQVLTNLIDNAIKYSRQSTPPRLGIRAEELAGAWRIVVSDNGIGFDMKYHDRIFGLFNRLVLPEEFEGSGAGLAIAKKLLDKHGGRIWAESALGQGTTFFVELPRQEQEPAPGGAQHANET